MPFVSVLRRFFLERQGGFAVPTAIALLPMVAIIFIAMDTGVTVEARNKLQADLDFAMTTGLQDHLADRPDLAVDSVRRAMKDIGYAGQPYELRNVQITPLAGNAGFVGEATATVSTNLVGLLGIQQVEIGVRSEFRNAASPDPYIEISLVLDKTMSMLAPATREGMNAIAPASVYWGKNCNSACHSARNVGDDGRDIVAPALIDGTNYSSLYALARARNVRLQADVQDDAVKAILSTIEKLDPAQKRIKVVVYTFGSSPRNRDLRQSLYYPDYPDEYDYRIEQSLQKVIPPTLDTLQVRREFGSRPELDLGNGQTLSDFRALTTLPRLMGVAGDGSTPERAKKLVLLITDGMQSSVALAHTNDWSLIGPMDAEWCKPLKDHGATLGVLGINYLPVPDIPQGEKGFIYSYMMKGMYDTFNYKWGAHNPLDDNVRKAEMLKPALTACASTPDSYMAATDLDRIRKFVTDMAGGGGPANSSWYISQ